MKLVTVLYANRHSPFLFGRSGCIPSEHEIPRNYTIVYQKLWGDSVNAEKLFNLFNTEDAIGQDVARLVGHTSMSVGDIVCIGNERFFCASVGWTKLDIVGRR